MRIGVCTRPESLRSLAGPPGGLDYIECPVGDVLCPREGEAAFESRLAAARAAPSPVEAANGFLPGDLKTTGPEVDVEALDAFVATAMQRAARIGIRTIVFGSGASRRVPDGFEIAAAAEQIVGHLKRWGPVAAARAVTIALEPLNKAECNIVTSVDEGADLVRRAAHPNIRLLVDTYHMARSNEPPEAIRRSAGLVAHVHCAEGDGRGPLGTKGEDQRPFFRALKDIGYDGRVSIEAGWQEFAAQLPAALAELRRQIEEA